MVSLVLVFAASGAVAVLQTFQPPKSSTEPQKPTAADVVSNSQAAAAPPKNVEGKPIARDDEIKDRLTRIMQATEWFHDTEVSVKEGVVFLVGRTSRDGFKTWPGDLAHNTRDVVAVVNRIEVEDPVWDYSLVWGQLTDLGRSFVLGLPTLVFALIVLPIAWVCSRLVSKLCHRMLPRSVNSELLRRLVAGCIGAIVFLVAIYLVLRFAGLMQLALTLVGGTGLLGLAWASHSKILLKTF